jgi:NADH-quinone oxidoreductase subunit L
VVGGAIQIPGVDEGITKFLRPAFADSHLAEIQVRTTPAWVGLIIGAAVALSGIAIAYSIWVRSPGIATAMRERLPAVHRFLVNKWYFDELIDLAIVRPALWLGRVAESVFERAVIGGGVTGGTVAIVRAGSAAVRRAQTGFLRYYAAAMLIGLSATALYFLISST